MQSCLAQSRGSVDGSYWGSHMSWGARAADSWENKAAREPPPSREVWLEFRLIAPKSHPNWSIYQSDRPICLIVISITFIHFKVDSMTSPFFRMFTIYFCHGRAFRARMNWLLFFFFFFKLDKTENAPVFATRWMLPRAQSWPFTAASERVPQRIGAWPQPHREGEVFQYLESLSWIQTQG